MGKAPYKPVPLEEFIAGLPKERQKAIEKRTRDLLAGELSLQNIRKSVGKTQVAVAKRMRVGQDAISKMETRDDMYLSTLRGFIEAMGGTLELTAKFPDLPPVKIAAGRKTKRAA